MVTGLGDSVLERLVEMSSLSSDADYRQMLTDRVIAESLVVARLEREQANYEEIIRALLRAGTLEEVNSRNIQESTVQSGLEDTFDKVGKIVERINEIYQDLSTYNLNPTTLLYSVNSGFTIRTERSVSSRDLALAGLLVFLLSLIIVPAGCLGHSYFQREIVHQGTDEQRGGKAVAENAKGLREEEPAKRTASG